MNRNAIAAAAAWMLVCTPPAFAQTNDERAAEGSLAIASDEALQRLSDRMASEAEKRGFAIGVAVAAGQSAWGPGKQAFEDALPADERAGFHEGALFQVNRNAWRDRAALGASIADRDQATAGARGAVADPRFEFGFDVATAIFGDPAMNAQGNAAAGPGSLGVRDTLSERARAGFDASMNYNLARRGLALQVKAPPKVSVLNAGALPTTRLPVMPDVTWKNYDEAYAALSRAGFASTKTETEHDPAVPLGYVTATTPAAGALVPDGAVVELRVPRPASVVGEGYLNAMDSDRRMGFDLDTGKYQQMTYGADVAVRWSNFQKRVEPVDGSVYYDDRGYYLVATDGATLFGENQPDGRYMKASEIGSYTWYSRCKFWAASNIYAVKRIWIRPDETTGVCVRTTAGALAFVMFQAGDWKDENEKLETNELTQGRADLKFRYALFPRQSADVAGLKKDRIATQPRVAPQN